MNRLEQDEQKEVEWIEALQAMLFEDFRESPLRQKLDRRLELYLGGPAAKEVDRNIKRHLNGAVNEKGLGFLVISLLDYHWMQFEDGKRAKPEKLMALASSWAGREDSISAALWRRVSISLPSWLAPVLCMTLESKPSKQRIPWLSNFSARCHLVQTAPYWRDELLSGEFPCGSPEFHNLLIKFCELRSPEEKEVLFYTLQRLSGDIYGLLGLFLSHIFVNRQYTDLIDRGIRWFWAWIRQRRLLSLDVSETFVCLHDALALLEDVVREELLASVGATWQKCLEKMSEIMVETLSRWGHKRKAFGFSLIHRHLLTNPLFASSMRPALEKVASMERGQSSFLAYRTLWLIREDAEIPVLMDSWERFTVDQQVILLSLLSTQKGPALTDALLAHLLRPHPIPSLRLIMRDLQGFFEDESLWQGLAHGMYRCRDTLRSASLKTWIYFWQLLQQHGGLTTLSLTNDVRRILREPESEDELWAALALCKAEPLLCEPSSLVTWSLHTSPTLQRVVCGLLAQWRIGSLCEMLESFLAWALTHAEEGITEVVSRILTLEEGIEQRYLPPSEEAIAMLSFDRQSLLRLARLIRRLRLEGAPPLRVTQQVFEEALFEGS
ncbi:MAG: hypothetical protein H6728_13320 [Myxococcales bacterium]|nr:hypothetical protein [Myxococcales bacterium]